MTVSTTCAVPVGIEFDGLTRYYGSTRGIDDLTLTVSAGEVFGFLGPNGAGKTTTIRLLMGLLRPTRGSVQVLGQDIRTHYPRLRARIGYLPGDLGLYPELTGREYLRHLARLRGSSGTGRLTELTDRFEIAYDRPIRACSKGMRQVLGIVQAFVHSPALVVLDEPTSGLDPLHQERFHELLRHERENGTTVFLSSHILSEVRRICDRVAMVRQGRLARVLTIDGLVSAAGRTVRIRGAGGSGPVERAVRGLDGVRHPTRDGDVLRFRYHGDVNALLRRLADVPLEDFACADPDLDDAFLDLYREAPP